MQQTSRAVAVAFVGSVALLAAACTAPAREEKAAATAPAAAAQKAAPVIPSNPRWK